MIKSCWASAGPRGDRDIMPAAVAIPAIIGAGASVGSAVIGSKAAKGAAKTQAQAAAQAAEIGLQAAREASAGVESATQTAVSGVKDATTAAVGDIEQATQAATGVLQPYLNVGTGAATTLAEMMSPTGEFNRRFTAADMEAYDPGYQFRLAEGQKALERSAALRGSVLSGGALKALTKYSQNVASEEFGKAFDRFQTENQNRFTRLATMMNTGLSAAGQFASTTMQGGALKSGYRMSGAETAANLGMRGAETAGSFKMQGAGMASGAITGAANASAAGTMGSANAWTGAIGNASNSALSSYLLWKLMQPQAGATAKAA